MKKKKALVLTLATLAMLSIGVACAELDERESYQEKGYKISVTYDANGGSFMSRPSVTLIDMFNPDDYEKDANGEIHIKLVEPTSSSRPTSGASITLSKSGNFYAGWYAKREVKTTEDGTPVDAAGEELLQLEDGSYVYASTADSDKPQAATPAYIYSDPWDFENDTIDYLASDYKSTNGVYSLTLYAGWVQDYEFNYYYKVEGDSNWTKLDTVTTFDYKSVSTSDSDKDTIWVPRWEDGAMKYTHSYNVGNNNYSFPKIEGTTFSKAYLDAECQQEITDSYQHGGDLDWETATATGRVQDVYIVVEKGERYKISNASQFVKNPNAQGIYEIQPGVTELNFAESKWPTAFTQNVFEGKIYTVDGSVCTFKNVFAEQKSVDETVAAGGLFAEISNVAEIRNVAFKNVTYDLAVSDRTMDMQFGLFAGVIDEEAKLINVSVTDSVFQIGDVGFGSGYALNLLAGGDTSEITANNLSLRVYGEDLAGAYYRYKVDPTTVTVDAERNISLELTSFKIFKEETNDEVKYYYEDEELNHIYVDVYFADAEDTDLLYYDIQIMEV